MNGYREIDWEALIPPAWDPKRALAGLDLSKLNDNDPEANEALARLRSSWAAAPLAESMNNARIRIAGFVVPLEYVGDKVTEFLLVPTSVRAFICRRPRRTKSYTCSPSSQ